MVQKIIEQQLKNTEFKAAHKMNLKIRIARSWVIKNFIVEWQKPDPIWIADVLTTSNNNSETHSRIKTNNKIFDGNFNFDNKV